MPLGFGASQSLDIRVRQVKKALISGVKFKRAPENSVIKINHILIKHFKIKINV